MRNTCVFVLIACCLLSCKKKFKHAHDASGSMSTTCVSCPYADSISGNYRGLATGLHVPNNSDSLTITVEHVFLNLGGTLDSTRMFFDITLQFDSNPTPQYTHTGSIPCSNSGFSASNQNGGYHTDILIANDSLHYHDWAYFWQTGFSYEYVLFKGKKL